ncbi:murein biosynthesis integral membrane protein MurJ [Planosporangium thailandense]|uniref:Murein biosynthesis integral membrane protein MurJ n=1 Tax=Planosporangium thailandense TaxID=765197 RepID=A0ABX0Y587_9ACTN|nr:murein biosynthesis integral membrane protein MurJ [Planosporangium thailandense]NJC72560.1 murein biosynthesis integral membrane protein MurJ [Planosporangium thailandense]
MATATAASRVTGFVRVLVLAAALGFGSRLLDSYNVANTLPNTVYDLVAGGAMAGVVVPLLTRAALTDHDGGVGYAQRLLSLLAYGLGFVTVLSVLLAPYLVDLCAPGFTPDQRQLAVVFSRYFLPQILFYGLSAAAGAVLNIRGRFAAPTWAPLVNNVVVIAVGSTYLAVGGATSVPALTPAEVLLLAVGTTSGVIAQMALVVRALARSGFPLRLRLDPRGIGVRRIGRLGGWVLLSVAAAQLLSTVANRIASTAGAGAVSVFQYAYTLFQLPYAVVALSLMTAILPRLSRHAAHRDYPQLIDGLSRSLRLTGAVLVPVAAAMVALGPYLAVLLFAHGHSDPMAVSLLGATVAAFGLLLLPFTGYMILLRGFYALQDTRTPALVTTFVSVVGIGGCLAARRLLAGHDLVVGLPAAYALAYACGLVAAGLLLRRRMGRLDGRRVARSYTRMTVAVIVAVGVAATVAHVTAPHVGTGWAGSSVILAAAALAGAASYAAVARLVRLGELREIVVATFAGFRAT